MSLVYLACVTATRAGSNAFAFGDDHGAAVHVGGLPGAGVPVLVDGVQQRIAADLGVGRQSSATGIEWYYQVQVQQGRRKHGDSVRSNG
jgi:hypothetical protein